MHYEAITSCTSEEAKISVVKGAEAYFCADVVSKHKKVLVKYSVEEFGRNSHLKLKSISFTDDEDLTPMMLTPMGEKHFPEDFLEELAVLVKIHRVDGVYWNDLHQITVFDPEDYPEHYLEYKVVQGLGSSPKVIFHEKKGDYFFKWHDEVTYKGIAAEDILDHFAQANRIGSSVAIPEWILMRDTSEGGIKYRRLRDNFSPYTSVSGVNQIS